MVTSTKSDATQKKILQAAAQALVDGGAGALRVDQVAADAGINKRMIYHHFGDRAGLIAAAVESQLHLLLGISTQFSAKTKDVLRLFARSLQLMGRDGTDHNVGGDPQASNEMLRRAARIVLAHFLIQAKSPDLAEVQPAQWQQFAAEMLSCAFADVTSSSRLSRPD